MTPRILLLLGLMLLGAVPQSNADDDAQRPTSPPLTRSPNSPDFMLRAPRGWLSVGGSMVYPRADGDIFTFFNNHLTLAPSDFRSAAAVLEVGVTLAPHVDIVTGVEGGRRRVGSEYRDFVFANRDPIQQETRLTTANMTVGMRYLPLGRGRRLSQFVFVPRRVSPFVGAGLNVGHYRLSQSGQFVDVEDRSIFRSFLRSSGWGTGSYLQGGADLQIWRGLYLKVDGKYTWVRSSLTDDFVGFDGINLSGFRTTTGLSVMF